MKIVVCVKEVPDSGAARRLDPETKRLDRSGEKALNSYDTHALEEAVRIVEGDDSSEVVVLSMGPEGAVRTLHKALSLGASRAILVTDPALAGADITLTASVLAAACAREDPDLVLLGQQSADGDSYVMAAAVADRLQRPLCTQVAHLEVVAPVVRAKRQSEAGYDVIELPLPAVVSVSDSINEPRYASLKAIMGARKKPLEQLALADLGLTAETGTEVLEISPPPPKQGGRTIEDEGGSSAEQVLGFLVERKVLS